MSYKQIFYNLTMLNGAVIVGVSLGAALIDHTHWFVPSLIAAGASAAMWKLREQRTKEIVEYPNSFIVDCSMTCAKVAVYEALGMTNTKPIEWTLNTEKLSPSVLAVHSSIKTPDVNGAKTPSTQYVMLEVTFAFVDVNKTQVTLKYMVAADESEREIHQGIKQTTANIKAIAQNLADQNGEKRNELQIR